MVFGFPIAVTAVPSVYQCADTHRMALGFGIDSPSWRQASVYGLRSSVFIGLPWPKNTTGILDPLRCIRARSREIEKQDLGVLRFFEHDLGGVDGFQRVPGLERLAVRRQAAARNMHVGAPTRSQLVDDAVAAIEQRRVQVRILMNRHRAPAAVG